MTTKEFNIECEKLDTQLSEGLISGQKWLEEFNRLQKEHSLTMMELDYIGEREDI